MGKKTDFFELPVGDQHHRECIEIEYSDEYRQGFEEGVESFRPKFEEFKKSLQEHHDEKLKEFQKDTTCHTCAHYEDDTCIHTDTEDFYTCRYIQYSGCGLHQLKES
ncbi:MAG: hypothetical protein PHE37_11660 [Sulfuricurvum sp.]|nr:hypothetical protein [Sulfuricurvum sp.]